MKHARLASSAIALALASVLLSPSARAEDAEDQSHRHGQQDGDIVVTGHPPVDFGLLASTATLEGEDLVRRTRGQLGDMLATLPGVSATAFSPGASRPVLRGFDGDRIRVLTDGIGSIDASSVSVDHAVVFDPLTVDHIDVVHGPAVLLFGGQAIGGAVNALDKRIPRSVPERVSLEAIGTFGTAADEKSVGAAAQIPLGPRFAAQVDASYRRSNDLRVGGYVNSPQLRAYLLDEAAGHLADGEPEEAGEYQKMADLKDRVPNTAARNWTLGAGLAFIDEGGNLGVSVQRTDSRYGVPTRPGAGHHHEEAAVPGGGFATLAALGGDDGDDHGEEPVTIGLVQTRVDLRGEVKLGGLFDSLHLRGAFADYQHIEFEGDEVGTTFSANGLEFRTDLVQRDNGGWRGRSGVQYFTRKMTIVGPEAFVPDNTIARFGVFTLQSVKLGAFEIEGAARYERASTRSNPAGYDRAFDLWSGAAGLSFVPAEGWKVGANYIRGARAPAPEELLSDGLHIATQAYEVGNPAFRAETSDGFEAYLRYSNDRLSLSLTGFLTDFDSFIASVPTGSEIDDFPVFAFVQLPARFKGFEAEASFEAMRWDSGSLRLDAGADFVHAELKGAGPAPRIPPLRLRGGAEFRRGAVTLRGGVEWNRAQNRVATYENPTAAFTLVNLGADWKPFGEDGPLTLSVNADNLFDVIGRRATSVTRDFVPISGRDVRVSARFTF